MKLWIPFLYFLYFNFFNYKIFHFFFFNSFTFSVWGVDFILRLRLRNDHVPANFWIPCPLRSAMVSGVSETGSKAFTFVSMCVVVVVLLPKRSIGNDRTDWAETFTQYFTASRLQSLLWRRWSVASLVCSTSKTIRKPRFSPISTDA